MSDYVFYRVDIPLYQNQVDMVKKQWETDSEITEPFKDIVVEIDHDGYGSFRFKLNPEDSGKFEQGDEKALKEFLAEWFINNQVLEQFILFAIWNEMTTDAIAELIAPAPIGCGNKIDDIALEHFNDSQMYGYSDTFLNIIEEVITIMESEMGISRQDAIIKYGSADLLLMHMEAV